MLSLDRSLSTDLRLNLAGKTRSFGTAIANQAKAGAFIKCALMIRSDFPLMVKASGKTRPVN